MMIGGAGALVADLLGDLQALHAALEQGIDHHHVRPQLVDLIRHGPAVLLDVEQLDALLAVQQVAHVLRHLRDVLDEEQADLIREG